MKRDSTKPAADVADGGLFDNWFDPIETALRTKVRGFIETLVEEELGSLGQDLFVEVDRQKTAPLGCAAMGLDSLRRAG